VHQGGRPLTTPNLWVHAQISAVPIPDISPDLLPIAVARQVTHGCPTQLCHQLRQAPVDASCAAAVRHLEHVQQGLARHTFQAVKLGLAC
jgi:hypothetical protein